MDEAAIVIGVDTGGTFTDVFVSNGVVRKVPSRPRDPSAAILAGLRAAGMKPGDAVSHGTTVATNTVLERKGARTALLTTAGFEDVLAIRRQSRPALYDLNARWPEPLVPRELRLGVTERLDWEGHVLEALDEAEVQRTAMSLRDEEVEAVAICLLFAYANPEHEQMAARAVCAAMGDNVAVSVSHELAPQYGEFERTSTTVVNAYVTPVMTRYLRSLQVALEREGVRTLHVMHSNGGLVTAHQASERPVQTVLSGPAAGVVGARTLAAQAGHDRIITFDMGGTSTDVAVVPGEVMESSEGEISSFPLLMPMLAIETVGAGGGSIARVDAAGGFHVGPESAGADPGPAAYGRGSRPTVTDANLLLGRLSPAGLLGGTLPLHRAQAREALRSIADPLGLTPEEAAWAVARLVNSNMERAVRTVTLQRGHDPRRFALFAFGGAGPLHAAELAADLGIDQVLIPPHPGVMAALGLTVPDFRRDYGRTVLLPLRAEIAETLEDAFTELESGASEELGAEELFGEPRFERFVDLRYTGQSFDLRVPYRADITRLQDAFTAAYEARFGYATPDKTVEVVNVRMRAVLPRRRTPRLTPAWPEGETERGTREVLFGSPVGVSDLRSLPTRVLWRPALERGATVEGPAVLEQYDSCTVVPPGWRAEVDDGLSLVVTRT